MESRVCSGSIGVMALRSATALGASNARAGRLPKLDDNVATWSHTAGMTSIQKIAVSLPKHVVEGARRAVRSGRAKSVSAYVADALEEQVKLDDLSLLLDEMLAQSGGPLTAAERRAADRALGAVKPAPRKRRAR